MLDNLITAACWVWLVAAIVLIFVLKIFRAGPLRGAPRRTGTLWIVHVAGVFLFYCGFLLLTTVALLIISPPPDPGPRTHWFTPAAAEPAYLQAMNLYDSRTQIISSFAALVPTGLLILLAHISTRGGIKNWGLNWRKIPPSIGAGLLGFIVIMPLMVFCSKLMIWLMEWLSPQKAPSVHPVIQMMENAGEPPLYKIFLAISAAVLAPFCEELFFRGILQTVLLRPWRAIIGLDAGGGGAPELQEPTLTRGTSELYLDYASAGGAQFQKPTPIRRWTAILIVSVFFAAAHFIPKQMNLDQLPLLFLLSTALGYVYERTGSLWACITLHAAFNTFSLALATFGGNQ